MCHMQEERQRQERIKEEEARRKEAELKKKKEEEARDERLRIEEEERRRVSCVASASTVFSFVVCCDLWSCGDVGSVVLPVPVQCSLLWCVVICGLVVT